MKLRDIGRALDRRIERLLDVLEFNATAFFIWGLFAVLCAVLTIAIKDHERQERERLERVHTHGMAVGATMCPSVEVH